MAKIKAAHVSDRQEKQRLAAMVLERTGELQRELAGRRQAEEELRRAHAELIASYAAAPVALPPAPARPRPAGSLRCRSHPLRTAVQIVSGPALGCRR